MSSIVCLIATPQYNRAETPGGGGVLSPKLYVDVPAGPRKSDYLYTNFLPNFPPISIPFSKEKHSIWIKLGAFYNIVSDENPPIAIPNFAKKCPKRQAHIRIPCQCENPPGAETQCTAPQRNTFIMFQWSMTLCFIDSQWNMLYPVWKCFTYRTAQSLY